MNNFCNSSRSISFWTAITGPTTPWEIKDRIWSQKHKSTQPVGTSRTKILSLAFLTGEVGINSLESLPSTGMLTKMPGGWSSTFVSISVSTMCIPTSKDTAFSITTVQQPSKNILKPELPKWSWTRTSWSSSQCPICKSLNRIQPSPIFSPKNS